jgi:hypothetical protein
MNNQFVVAEMYFRVTYAEVEMKHPLIDSFVFVGMNLYTAGAVSPDAGGSIRRDFGMCMH